MPALEYPLSSTAARSLSRRHGVPRIARIRASRNGRVQPLLVSRIRPPSSSVHTRSKRRWGKSDDRSGSSVRRQRRHVIDTAQSRRWPCVRSGICRADRSGACTSSLGGRQRASPWAAVLAGPRSFARVSWHPSALETELVRPKWRSDGAPCCRLANLPCPEKEVLKISRVSSELNQLNGRGTNLHRVHACERPLLDRRLFSRAPPRRVHPFNTSSSTRVRPAVELEGAVVACAKVDSVEEEATVIEPVTEFTSGGHSVRRHRLVESGSARLSCLGSDRGSVLGREAEVRVGITNRQ